MEVLNRNGFDIVVDDSEDRDPSKTRLSLVGQPVSKSVTFDMKGACGRFHFTFRPNFISCYERCLTFLLLLICLSDLEEILSLMHDRPAGQMVRCSKVRAMFASRACRKSVMIGDSLNRQQMIKVRKGYGHELGIQFEARLTRPTQILQNMSTIEQPWNCPHGRPTMRHLCDISEVPQRPVEVVDWDGYRRRLLRKRG